MRLFLLLALAAQLAQAAASAKYGSFSLNTTTGNQAVTGVGFQPKAIIFYGSGDQTADGSATSARHFIGFGVDSTHQAFHWGGATNGQTTSITSQNINTTACIAFSVEGASGTATAKALADFISMDADGFTIHLSVAADATARVVNYLALGGASITNAYVGTGTAGTSTGTKAYTGVGFQPDALLFLDGTNTALGVITTNIMTMGWALSSTARGVMGSKNRSGLTTTDSTSYQVTTSANIMLGNTSAKSSEGDLSTMDADGFTLNWTTAGSAREFVYLALKGGNYSVGSFNQPTSNGTSVVSSLGYQPAAVLLMSNNLASSSSVQTVNRTSLGTATSSTARGAIWQGDTNGVTTTVDNSWLDRAKVIKMATEGTPSVTAEADFTSMDSGGFTITWSTTDATARQVLYMAIGPAAAAAGTAAAAPQRGH